MIAEAGPRGLLITNATLLTLDDDRTIIDNGAVAIDGELMEDALLQRIDDAKEIVLVPKMEGG